MKVIKVEKILVQSLACSSHDSPFGKESAWLRKQIGCTKKDSKAKERSTMNH